VVGELLIGGDGVAIGYINKPELTVQKFDHDFRDYLDYHNEKTNQKLLWGVQGGGFLEKNLPGRRRQKIYKTGDLGRWLFNGEIEFLGRLDLQVKIRGFRIELEEIEAQLVKHEAIREALVVIEEESGTSGIAGKKLDKYLCAYIVPVVSFEHKGEESGVLSASLLREYLSRNLPQYMIPSHFISLEAIPLTLNNKVDRKALPDYRQNRLQVETAYAAPGTDYEKNMAQLWQEILKLDKVGIHDNFFELGGNSMKLIQLNARLNEVFSMDISVMKFFRYPTIHSLLSHWEGGDKDIAIINKQIQDSRSDLEETLELLTGMNND
jgi:fengycin family lipopeptide synthetase D